MRSFAWQDRIVRSGRVAVLLPGGSGYTVRGPLLHWSAALLFELGWHVQAVEWTITPSEREQPQAFVAEAVAAAFEAAPAAEQRLVVGKSFGSHALPWAVANAVPGIWLTPVLTDEAVARALATAGTEHLAVGGDQDELWRPDAVGPTAATMVTVTGADHALESRAGWRESQALQRTVLERITAFVTPRSSAATSDAPRG